MEELEGEILTGDKNRLKQILINLISNAIKFTNQGKVRVCFSKTLEKENAVYIKIVVSDTGIGMNKEFLKKMYRPFEQQDVSLSQKYGGTGLGLPITKYLVDLMGGTILAESEENRGTTFTVELPFYKTEACEALEKHEFDRNFEGKKILLAEDNEMNMEIANEIFSSKGLQMDWAKNGADAVEMFLKSEPGYYSGIFMDVQMPEMDGISATNTIRKSNHPDAKKIPIIAMSAYAFREDVGKMLAAGMTDHVAKPIDIKELFRVMDKNIL